MNGCQSSTESYSERQYNLQRVSDFHAVLLGMAAHDLRQPLQVIQSTYEWLSGRFDDDVERMGCNAASVRFPDSASSSIG